MTLPLTFPAAAAIALCTVAAGCGEGTLTQAADSPYAPVASGGLQDGVDGLVVGHRLMAAGEYELALEAYLRGAATRGIDVDVLSALGSANLRLGRLGQAETLLRRAIETDETFPPAWNNLGVVLMERGEYGEASRVFRTAFALDSGRSDEMRENLRLALAKMENPGYSTGTRERFALVRRGRGDYRILSTPQ